MIDHVIPQHRFEIVLNNIGAILLSELNNQKLLNNFNELFEVFKERQTPIDKGEEIVINLTINNIDYNNHNAFNSDGTHTIHIEVYVNGYETSALSGSEVSNTKLNKTVGLIKYILSHDEYFNLGFSVPVIASKTINSVSFDKSITNQDASFSRMAVIEMSARFSENYQDNTLVPLLGNDTGVKINLTEKGFKFEFNN